MNFLLALMIWGWSGRPDLGPLSLSLSAMACGVEGYAGWVQHKIAGLRCNLRCRVGMIASDFDCDYDGRGLTAVGIEPDQAMAYNLALTRKVGVILGPQCLPANNVQTQVKSDLEPSSWQSRRTKAELRAVEFGVLSLRPFWAFQRDETSENLNDSIRLIQRNQQMLRDFLLIQSPNLEFFLTQHGRPEGKGWKKLHWKENPWKAIGYRIYMRKSA